SWPRLARPKPAVAMLATACLLTALAGRLAYLVRPFDHDAAMFVYLGKSVCDGQRFGHDIIDNKFPSVGLMTSLAWRMFGTCWPAYVLLQTVLALGGAWMLARAAARNAGEQARLPTLLAAVVYLNFTVGVFGGFQLETLQSFFAILAACAAMEAIRGRSVGDALLVGLAAGCAAMLKPTGLAPLGAFAVVMLVLCARPLRCAVAVAAATALGLSIPVATVVIHLISTDTLGDIPRLYRQICLYASQTPMVWHEDILKPITVLALAGFAIVVRGWVQRRDATTPGPARSVVIFAVLWLVLELLGAVMQRRMYAYHFLPLAAPAALLFGMIPRRNDPMRLLAALAPVMMLSLIGSAEVLKHPQPTVLPVSRYLLERALPGDRVWQDSMPRLLLETGLQPGARFPLMFIFGNHDSAAVQYTPLLLSDFEQRHPRYIILPTDVEAKLRVETTQCLHLLRSPVRAENFRHAWRQIATYVADHYTPEAQIGHETIWRRR
ncbi:MAG TPA: hypothetical protein VNL70_01890, partial [Tepidisphaeraceae bacterium]|nr:hypothetical protein [Tepidisphaeraceae bacterium]